MIARRRSRLHPAGGWANARSAFQRQSELPHSIPLFRYVPVRGSFSWRDWNPSRVRSVGDLPPYLILGNLDPSTFDRTGSGWSARWQGTEDDTHFDVDYRATTDHYEVRQTWRGVDGGFAFYQTRVPLDKIIGQAMNWEFPRAWDRAAKAHVESGYQVSVVDPTRGSRSIFGIPDGAFRTIVFPLAVRDLRPTLASIRKMVESSPLAYPLMVEAKLVDQVVDYLEGKAPEWTTRDAATFARSTADTGLAPQGFPAHATFRDRTAAWTLRRKAYFMFIRLPFAGLTDFLARAVDAKGPVRATSDPHLRFELRPLIVPALFEMRPSSVAIMDSARTTRSFIHFEPRDMNEAIAHRAQFIGNAQNDLAALAEVEAISAGVVEEVERIYGIATEETR
jgi:hypothetical protein